MTATHTPGPWIVESDGTTVSMGNQAVIVGPAPDGARRETMTANARLIAAAPRMSAAIKRTASLLAEMNDQTPQIIALRHEIIETIKASTPEYFGL
jgi:hypothetical protein